MDKSKYKGFKDLKVYQLSYKLSVEIFEVTKCSVPAQSAQFQLKAPFHPALLAKVRGSLPIHQDSFFINSLMK